VNPKLIHPWKLELLEAKGLQDKLCLQVRIEKPSQSPSLIAGVDLAYIRDQNLAIGAAIVFRLPELDPIAQATTCQEIVYPYIPGLLSFREGPVVLATLQKITSAPDAIIFDGQGIAHPKGLGLASHMGVLLDIPTIGCAKKPLIGHYDPVGEEPGEFSLLLYNSKVVGAALRTKRNTKPVFVSPGHKIDLGTSIELIRQTCRGYRLPEPIRQAHLLANKTRNAICSGFSMP
jgi:deoxyribonuclease V